MWSYSWIYRRLHSTTSCTVTMDLPGLRLLSSFACFVCITWLWIYMRWRLRGCGPVGCVRRARMQKRQVASRLSAKSAGLYDHMHKTYKKCQKSCACGTWETSISTREGNAAFCRVKVETVLTVLFLQRNFCLEVEFTLTDEAYPPYRWSMCLPVTLFLKKPRCLIPLLIKSKTGARVRRCRGKIKGRWGDESLSPTHKRRAPAWGNHCCCTCTVLTHVESALTSISQYNVHNIMHCTLYASVIILPLLPHDSSTVY